MKTVLIVDDERPARELLKMTLDWTEAGFLAPLEARNGAEAFSIYEQHRPDLIITDIQMPVMDGLELIRKIRLISPTQDIVILSCHESFFYAREAIQLGVLDYLIKDALTSSDLLDILLRIPSSGAKPKPTSQLPVLPITQPSLLSRALRENLSPSQITALLQPLLQQGQSFFCCAIKPEDPAHLVTDVSGSIEAEIRQILQGFDGGEVCQIQNSVFLVLAFVAKDFSRMSLFNRRCNIIQDIRVALEQFSFHHVTVGVSCPSKEPIALCQAIDEAQQALSSRAFFGKGRTIYFDPAQSGSRAAQLEILELRIEQVKNALENSDIELLSREVSALYKKDLQGMQQYNYLQHINTVLLGMLTQGCSANEISYRDVFCTDTVSMDIVEQLETVDKMCTWYLERFAMLITAVQKQEQLMHSPRTQRIKSYISENYCKDISLDTIADTFNIHKVYLAKIFKKETGQSVNEHIRMLRIERAKELLCRDDTRISDLVGMLGFNNPQTFYNIFKRSVGVSPKEYRDLYTILK
ncbi:response regulator [Hydrogenoanaerobacterium sp.]|uniref:response regulator n=1 Tax=Hydrogenoanaerobacterium sp. TaxID=2953763 RepID=UPI0028999CFA|nr:response regulator [Hydrogenoanaerobacterium sp.]